MRYFAVLLLGTILLTSCQTIEKSARQQFESPKQNEAGKKFSQVTVKEETNNVNISISSYTLITNNAEAHRAADAGKSSPSIHRTSSGNNFSRRLSAYRIADYFTGKRFAAAGECAFAIIKQPYSSASKTAYSTRTKSVPVRPKVSG